MTSKTLRQRLQAQYSKLNIRIQKSIKTGRFYQYTQFKRDQLFGRLERYALQMKRLSMGLGLVAALGVATPVVGQVAQMNIVERTGAANPLGGLNVLNPSYPFYSNVPVFVDMDNDGDLDFFVERSTSSSNSVNYVRYFENTGSVNAAVFQERMGSNNPLDGIGDGHHLTFVDIDNDGDMDCFRGNNAYLYTPANNNLYYYRNDGTVNAPDFVLQASNMNPLDSVIHHLNALATSYSVAPMTTFSDIDNDGDLDCVVGVYSYAYTPANNNDLWYYENIGSSASPSFLRRQGTSNPLSAAMASLYTTAGALKLKNSVVITDTDNDGDQDVLFSLASATPMRIAFAENQGSAINPNWVLMNNTPIDSTIAPPVTGPNRPIQYHTLVDIDGDSDLDVFRVVDQDSVVAFYENLTFTSTSQIEKNTEDILMYPNPTNGILNLEKQLTGNVVCYDTKGAQLFSRVLKNDQTIDVSNLDNGLYFLSIETENAIIRKKVLIQK